MTYADMALKDIYGLPGVADLKGLAKGKFAQALQAEARGDYTRSAKLLEEAIATRLQLRELRLLRAPLSGGRAYLSALPPTSPSC